MVGHCTSRHVWLTKKWWLALEPRDLTFRCCVPPCHVYQGWLWAHKEKGSSRTHISDFQSRRGDTRTNWQSQELSFPLSVWNPIFSPFEYVSGPFFFRFPKGQGCMPRAQYLLSLLSFSVSLTLLRLPHTQYARTHERTKRFYREWQMKWNPVYSVCEVEHVYL